MGMALVVYSLCMDAPVDIKGGELDKEDRVACDMFVSSQHHLYVHTMTILYRHLYYHLHQNYHRNHHQTHH